MQVHIYLFLTSWACVDAVRMYKLIRIVAGWQRAEQLLASGPCGRCL